MLNEQENFESPSSYTNDGPATFLSSEKIVRFLARMGGLIGVSLDPEENLRNLEELVLPHLADDMNLWLLTDEMKLQSFRSPARQNLRGFLRTDSELPEQVIRSGLAIREKSYCCLPLRVRHEIIGILECRKRPTRFFETDDLVILDEIANRTAVAVENIRLFQTLKSTEFKLREAKRQAETASEAKSQFLANMSHEIRTPLGAILGFVDLMVSAGESPQDIGLWGQKIKKNGTHLLRIIDEILDLSKIESGRFEIVKQKVAIKDLLQEIHLSLLPQAVQKDIDLQIETSNPIPMTIQSDPTRLRQILFNLIGNAIKFTEKGHVKIEIAHDPHVHQLRFTVSDTGLGLTSEQSNRLFKPFSQGDTSHTRRFGGTGLGLVLSRNLARMLDGDVRLLNSTLGQGSTFEVTVGTGPLTSIDFFREFRSRGNSLPAAIPVNPQNQVRLLGYKILLVEDSADNQFLISRFLKAAGAEVDVAEDGARGLEKAMRGDYDIILMDIQMPLLNGHQVTQILRKNGDRRPILALTAHALKEEMEKSLASGCDDHLTKPIDREKLIDLVAFHGGRAAKAREASTSIYAHRVNMSGFHGDVRSP